VYQIKEKEVKLAITNNTKLNKEQKTNYKQVVENSHAIATIDKRTQNLQLTSTIQAIQLQIQAQNDKLEQLMEDRQILFQ
jgi:intracellular sulfur oxidation DsrE/DsrF family protein